MTHLRNVFDRLRSLKQVLVQKGKKEAVCGKEGRKLSWKVKKTQGYSHLKTDNSEKK